MEFFYLAVVFAVVILIVRGITAIGVIRNVDVDVELACEKIIRKLVRAIEDILESDSHKTDEQVWAIRAAINRACSDLREVKSK